MVIQTDFSKNIRLLDMKRDLDQVADLIELCFYHQMDPDGKKYLKQIRKAANNRMQQRYFRISGMQISYPIYGFVWEEDQKIVGNITMIPHLHRGKWKFLVANIAVNPDYRSRGIARNLTQEAIDHLNRNKINTIWLQVREDNHHAINLYRSLGFNDQAVRTMWLLSSLERRDHNISSHVSTERKMRADWNSHRSWLLKTYPEEITWYLPFDIYLFRSGIFSLFYKILNGKMSINWSAFDRGSLMGCATWQPTNMFADLIWLAVNERFESESIEVLLKDLRKHVILKKPILVNYPYGKGVESFISSGFIIHNTLIWMKYEKQQI